MIIATAGLMPLAGHAQGTDLQAKYKDHLQYCSTLTDSTRQAACRREAGAALHEARRNGLTQQGDTSANATARCQRLPAGRQAECERLMREGTVQQGSVSGGGVIRGLSITVPADTTTSGGYTTQPAPATTGTYQQAPSTGTYQAPPPAGTYQPAPAVRGTTGTQPGYGVQPSR